MRAGRKLFQNAGISGKAPVRNGDHSDYESDYFPCDFDNRINPDRNAGQRRIIFSGSAYLFRPPAAVWSRYQQYSHCCLRVEPKYGSRDWDYDGSAHIFPVAGTGNGFTALCAAVKNINQQILDTESYGRLPHRSISIEIFGSWNFDVGYLDTVASGNRCCTFSENRYRIKTVERSRKHNSG